VIEGLTIFALVVGIWLAGSYVCLMIVSHWAVPDLPPSGLDLAGSLICSWLGAVIWALFGFVDWADERGKRDNRLGAFAKKITGTTNRK